MSVEEIVTKFKKSYKKNGPDDLKSQIPFLAALAEDYILRAKQEPQKWTHLLKAHALFNSCAARAEREEHKLVWERKVYEVEALHFGKHQFKQKKRNKLNAQHRTHLAGIRDKMRGLLRPISALIESMHPEDLTCQHQHESERNFVTVMKRTSRSCTSKMGMLIEAIVKSCFLLVKEPPCAMAVVGLGSVARGETTPYSDLEYLFLIANSQYKSYFERLAIALYFLIGNLQETNLKCLSISELGEGNWFDDRAQSGLKIDGIGGNAGNIPTGNEEGTKYFIRTPEELAADYSNSYKTVTTESDVIGDLSDLLTSTRLLYSYQDGAKLHDEFKGKMIKELPTPARVLASLEILRKDSMKFDFLPIDFNDRTNRQLSVKNHIFRFPSILVEDAKILYRFTTSGFEEPNEDTCETVGKMVITFQWSSDTEHSLLFLLSVAMFIRLDAYLYYNSQKDNLTVLYRQNPEFPTGLYQFPRKLFHAYASFLFPAKQTFFNLVTSDLVSAASKYVLGESRKLVTKRAISTLQIKRDTELAKLHTHAFCLEWEECLQHLQSSHWGKSLREAVPADPMSRKHLPLLNLAAVAAVNVATKAGFEDACMYCNTALEILSSDKNMDPDQVKDLGNWNNMMGVALQGKGEHEEALNRFTQALQIVIGQTGPDAVDCNLASAYNNVGNSLLRLRRHTEALDCHKKAMEIRKKLFGEDAVYTDMAISYNNVGECLKKLGRDKEALAYLEKALGIFKRSFGEDAVNHDLAKSYESLGRLLRVVGRHTEGFVYLDKASDIFRKLFGENAVNNALASCYNIASDRMSALGRHEEALEHQQKALDIRKRLFGEDAVNSDLAASYNDVGICFQKLGRHDQDLVYQNKALDIRKRLFGEDAVNSDLAASYNNIGVCFQNLGRHKEAIEYQQKALDISKRLFGEDAVNSNLADSYNNVGGCFIEFGWYKEALVYKEKALDIRRRFYGEVAVNDDLATSYDDVGGTHMLLNQFAQSLIHLIAARSMYLKLGSLEDAIRISSNLCLCSISAYDFPASLLYAIQSVRYCEQLSALQCSSSVDVTELGLSGIFALCFATVRMAMCVAFNALNIADIWQKYRSKQD